MGNVSSMPAALAVAFAELRANALARRAQREALSLPAAAANSVTVYPATPGGPFTSIQAAINSISNSGPQNRYYVTAGPGTYNESITFQPYINVNGAGSDRTTLAGGVTAATNGTLENMTIAPASSPNAVTVGSGVTNFDIALCAIQIVSDGEVAFNGIRIDGSTASASATLDSTSISIRCLSPVTQNYPAGILATGQATVSSYSGSVTTNMPNPQDTGVGAGDGAAISLNFLSVTASDFALSTDEASNIYLNGCTVVGRTTGNIHGA